MSKSNVVRLPPRPATRAEVSQRSTVITGPLSVTPLYVTETGDRVVWWDGLHWRELGISTGPGTGESIWDDGLSIWDGGLSVWDVGTAPVAEAVWDGGATTWDNGLTTWDG
jgi:hypothetical protein